MAQPLVDAPVHLSARTIFDQQFLPLLLPTCGVCHKTQGGIGPAFLASGSPTSYDPYLVTSTWPNFIPSTDNAALSAVLSKGQHEGPALTIDQYSVGLSWVTEELAERSASTPQPFNPAVDPFIPVTTGATTTVQLGGINANFAGAYISFQATLVSPTLGIELKNLRFFNVQPGAMTGAQRAIHMQRPLFVMWEGTQAIPDPDDSFSSTDLTFPLEIPPAGMQPVGQLITPGLLILSGYRPGEPLSISFNLLQLVPPATGSNPCKPAGITSFYGAGMNGAADGAHGVVPFLAKSGACTQSNACHTTSGKAGGIDMTPIAKPITDPTLIALCESLKFYNNTSTDKQKYPNDTGTIELNTDPSNMAYHNGFKWTTGAGGNCALNGLQQSCFNDFQTALGAWRAAEQ
jgi:hypothetical protein